MTLDELALKHQTDKSSLGHFYTRWYEQVFGPLRAEKLTLLEIGVLDGRSLRMWEEWAPFWRVCGMDLELPTNPDSFPAGIDNGLLVFQGDQSDPQVLLAVNERFGPFNLIVDDGSHQARGQITSFQTLFPLLRPGGWYVVEDLHTSYPQREGYGGLEYFLGLAQQLHGEGRFDLGEPRNLPWFAAVKDTIPYNLRWLAEIRFYPNIVFIRKREEAL